MPDPAAFPRMATPARVLLAAAAAVLLGGCGSSPAGVPGQPSPSAVAPSTPADPPTDRSAEPTETMPVEPSAPAEPSPAAPMTPAPESATASVDIVDFDFQPSTIEVAPGMTVEWSNTGDVLHTVTFDDGTDSGGLPGGDGYERSFEEPGEYTYFCSFHGNMQGTVLVE